MINMLGKYCRDLFSLLMTVLFFSGIMSACDADESCFSFSTNRYRLGFYAINENGRQEATPFIFEEVEVLGSDSAFFTWSATGANSLTLALNPAADTTTFLFKYGDNTDTVRVSYKRNFRMISPDCGMEINYTNLKVFSHSFDSVRNLTTELLQTEKGFDVAVYSLTPCPSSNVSLFRAGFKSKNGRGEIETDLVNFDSVKAVSNDSVFFARTEEGTDFMRLGLNPEADSTVFLFDDKGQVDTLVVKYTRGEKIFSPRCGNEVEYLDLTISQSTFDSVSLVSTIIPETATQDFDVEIYRFE